MKRIFWSLPLCMLAVQALCASAALADDFPVPGELCSAELNFHDGNSTYHVPYCRNRSLNSVNPQVTRAVIVIPGSESPARTHYETVVRLAEQEGVDDTTTILVPNFLEDDGSGTSVLQNLGLSNDYLYWTYNWRYGYKSVNGNRISSFAVIDHIVRNLLDNNPNLKHIAVVGHSAGGRVVQRYAGGTTVVAEAAARGVTMSFGAFAPGTVMYLNDDRPYSTAHCDGNPANEGNYKLYPDGIDGLSDNAYMNNSTASEILVRMFTRHIYYTVGQADTDAFTDACDKVEGSNRLDLQRKYKEHLASACLDFYGGGFLAAVRCGACFFRGDDVFGELPGVHHSHREEYETDRGVHILFYWE